ncbi:DUF4097 family beta strand repeat-containing protein [uncultured Pseudoramibacter sp.]|uniref:DUF4097 family beta strand repeat-containing protein n=1 Tax=uncultured Pseudoramibacter sp. TaxID=1623493 RepID=UPI0025E6862F|nr:DUF4097 family beta strand repeat-containing protein [uncultured Pseudoramibacter sp.]
MKHKRTLYLVIIAALAAAAIGYGTVKHLNAAHLKLTLNGDGLNLTSSNPATVRKKLDAFDRADIHLDNTDITLQSGADFAMVYRGPKGTCPTLTVTDGKLIAKAAKTAVGAHQDTELVLTIPRSHTELQALTLASQNGDITVEPSQTLTVDTLTLDSQNGDIELSRSAGGTLKATTSNGDIDIEDAAFTTAELTADTGDLSLVPSDSLAHYTISAKTDTGDIDIEND